MQMRLKRTARALAAVAALVAIDNITAAQQATPPANQSAPATQTAAAQPAIDEWGDDFDGDRLDEAKWEPYIFEGAGSCKIEVKDKQLKLRFRGLLTAWLILKATSCLLSTAAA